MKKYWPLLLLMFFSAFQARATHLVGGTLYYECVGNGEYVMHCIRYTDPAGQAAQVPPFFDVRINALSSTMSFDISMNRVSMDTLTSEPSSPCLGIFDVSIVQHKYISDTFALDSNTAGYDVFNVSDFGQVIGDYARPSGIDNIENSALIGQTLHARIPDPATAPCNSAPEITSSVPVAFPVGSEIEFQYRVNDPDGDSVRYYLCEALDFDAYFPHSFPPHPIVPYMPGFSATNPLPAEPPLSIDFETGKLSGTPKDLGNYVVTICVDEFRNGQPIGTYRHEMMISIVNSNSSETTASIANGSDTIVSCAENLVAFENTSSNTTSLTTYFWDFGIDSIDSDTSTAFEPTYTYPDTGNYQITLITNRYEPCADTTTTTLQITRGVEAKFVADSSTHCPNDTIHFYDQSTAMDDPIVAYNWEFGNGNTATGDTAMHIFGQGDTFPVTLTVTTANGCHDDTTREVVVQDAPTLDVAQSFQICQGDSVILDIETSASQVQWQPGDNMSCTTCEDPLVWPQQHTAYEVVVTDSNGCKNNAHTNVLTYEPPNLDIDEALYFCGLPVVPDVAINDINSSFTLNWAPSHGLDTTAVLAPVMTPDSTTTYTLTVETSKGCVAKDSLPVYVENLSLEATASDRFICAGDSTQLMAVTDSANWVYLWNPSHSLNDHLVADPITKPASTAIYSVLVADPNKNGCENEDTVKVTVQEPAPITAGPDTTICPGDTVQLFADGGTSDYQWNSQPSLSCLACPDPLVNPTDTTTYVVHHVDSNGCMAKDSVRVNLYSDTIIAGTMSYIGGGDLETSEVHAIKFQPTDSSLTAIDTATTDLNGAYAIQPHDPDVYIRVMPDPNLYPKVLPTYHDGVLTWNDATKVQQHCDSVELNQMALVGNNPGGPGRIGGQLLEGSGKHAGSGQPMADVTLFVLNDRGEAVTYAITDSTGKFEFAGIPVGTYTLIGDIPYLKNDEAPEITLTTDTPAKDSLTVREVDLRLEIFDPTGIAVHSLSGIEVYPNPATDYFTIETDHEVQVEVVDISGKKQLEIPAMRGRKRISVSDLSAGTFVIKIRNVEGVSIRKLMITK